MAIETIHLNEQGVEGLLAFVVTAADTGAALATDRVDLIDEDNAGGELAGLFKGVAHASGPDADEHLDEVRTADAEERHARLAGDGAGEQGLTRARRANHQHSLRDVRANLSETLRVLQEVDDLLHLFLGLIATRDVLEGRGFLIGGVKTRAGFRELHRAAVGVLKEPVHHEQHHPRDEERGQNVVEEHRPTRLGGKFLKRVARDGSLERLECLFGQTAIGEEARLFVFLGARDFEFSRDVYPAIVTAGRVRLNRKVLDLLLLGVSENLGDLQLLDGVTGLRARKVEKGDDGGHQKQPDQHGFGVQAGAVFIIIRLVVLTHGQKI